jgi:hypothetical protein
LGKCPTFDIQITLVPVDYVCEATVHLASQEKSWGRAFHFFNPAPIEWSGLMEILRLLGYSVEEVPYNKWWQELKRRGRWNADDPSPDHSFFSKLLLALTAPHFLFYNRPPFDGDYTAEGLAGSAIACPPVDRDLIGAYVAWWQKTGYLPGVGGASLEGASLETAAGS